MNAWNFHKCRIGLVILVILALAVAVPALAQSGGGYNLEWNTVSGGGGVSTAGGYELTGAIGQVAAGSALAGSGYTLTAGFLVEPLGIPVTGGSVVYLPLVRK